MKTFWVASQATPPSCMSPSGNSFCRPLQNAAMATLGSASWEQCILTTHECVDRGPNHTTGPRGRTSTSLVADTFTEDTHVCTPPLSTPSPADDAILSRTQRSTSKTVFDHRKYCMRHLRPNSACGAHSGSLQFRRAHGSTRRHCGERSHYFFQDGSASTQWATQVVRHFPYIGVILVVTHDGHALRLNRHL